MHIVATPDPMIGPNITHRPHFLAFRLARTAAGLAAAFVVLALTQSSGWGQQQHVKSLREAAPAAAAAVAAAAVVVNGISDRALLTVEAGTAPGRLVRELIPRSGLPHVFSKARWDEGPVRVAFLGGSVTAKADCWRPQVMELLRSLYPSVEWAEINASLGGTGSLFGAFRVDRSVIAHKPDLLFIEYAANDRVATIDPLPTAEGVIRKIRRALPDCDMAIVYITTEALTQEYDLAAGRLPEVVQLYERLADHYDIPSVHLGLEIVEQAAVGEVVWYGKEAAAVATAAAGDTGAGAGSSTSRAKAQYIFGTDGIHPHKGTGCAAYARAINRSLAALEEHARLPRELLPAPLHPKNYEAARLVAPDRAALSVGVQKISPATAPGKPYQNATGYLARRPGDTFTLSFHGSVVGVSMIVGPWTGDLLLSLDGLPPRAMQIFDTFCYRPNGRMGFYLLHDDLAPANHTLVVDVSPGVPDKRAIMAAKNRRVPPEYLDDTDAVILGFGFV